MKKFIIAMLVGCLVGVVYSASIQTITVPATGASYLSGTWVNTITPKKAVELKSAFLFTASALTNEQITVKVSNGGVTYNVDNFGATNVTTGTVDFNYPVWCGSGQTVTVTRTVASTGIVVNVMLVVE